MKAHTFAAIFGAVLGVILIAGAASAVTVTVTPDHVSPGDEITVDIVGLPDGSQCVLEIDGALEIPDGATTFLFNTGNITMPFVLSPGSFVVTNVNTVSNRITVTETEDVVGEEEFEEVNGSVIDYVFSGTSTNGVFTKQINFPHPERGTYSVRSEGTVVTGTNEVSTSVQLMGTKTGVDDSQIVFALGDSDSGTMTVLITVNGTIVLSKEITITGNQHAVSTGPVFNNLGFLVTPAKGSSFVASANPFSVQPGSGAAVMAPGIVLSFFTPTSWSTIRWDNRWAAAFSV